MLADDLRILKSERMDDTDDGGGPASSQVVTGGVSNEIFPDISSVDRLHGELKMRKLFGDINTQTVEPLLGSSMIISKIPGDTQLGISLMESPDSFERRKIASDQISGEIFEGELTNIVPDHVFIPIGSTEIFVSIPIADPVPAVNDQYLIKLVDQTGEQVNKVVAVDPYTTSSDINYTTHDGYKLTVATPTDFLMTVSSGFPASVEFYTTYRNNRKIVSTQVPGAQILNGATSITASNEFIQIIPQSAVNDSNIAEAIGIDPSSIVDNGQVPAFENGDILFVIHDQETINTFISSTQTDLGRTDLAKITIVDAGNTPLDISKYTANLDTGLIDWGDLTGVSQPLTIVDRILNKTVVGSVSGTTITLATAWPITRDFPATGTLICNALVFGDIWAYTSVPFEQKTWGGTWSDTLIGQGTTAQYDYQQNPIVVENAHCIEERWRIERVSATHVNVIGEHVGQILSNADASVDIAPVNPNTGFPYFSIPNGGWGSGWNAGELLRFNTYAPKPPLWINETIEQGPEADPDFSFCLEFVGDVDTP